MNFFNGASFLTYDVFLRMCGSGRILKFCLLNICFLQLIRYYEALHYKFFVVVSDCITVKCMFRFLVGKLIIANFVLLGGWMSFNIGEINSFYDCKFGFRRNFVKYKTKPDSPKIKISKGFSLILRVYV